MKLIKCNMCNYREYANKQFTDTVESTQVKCLNRQNELQMVICSGFMKVIKDTIL